MYVMSSCADKRHWSGSRGQARSLFMRANREADVVLCARSKNDFRLNDTCRGRLKSGWGATETENRWRET